MAMERIKSNKIILPQGLFDGYVYFENGKIIDVSDKAFAADKEYDMTGLYLSAGFIDIHTHGGGGNPFEGNEEQIVNGCNFHLKHGTTSICPETGPQGIQTDPQAIPGPTRLPLLKFSEKPLRKEFHIPALPASHPPAVLWQNLLDMY